MDTVGVGVVGCGVIGNVHLQQLATVADARVVALADLRDEAAQAAAEKYDVAATYSDGRDLIADADVDAVIVATTANMHAPLTVAAFEQGKHVLVEKPAALDAHEVRAMMAAQGDRVGACCSCRYRLYRTAEVAAGYLAGGRLGALRTVRCRATHPAGPPPSAPRPIWRMSKALNAGGILTNWGCYDLDFLLGIMGWSLVPRHALALTYQTPAQFQNHLPPNQDAECHVVGMLTCDDGIALTYERAETYTGEAEATWQFTGEAGQLGLHMTGVPEGANATAHLAPPEGGLETEVLCEAPATLRPGHASPAEDFVRAIVDGTEPTTTLDQALLVVRISDAFYASAEQGRPVEVV